MNIATFALGRGEAGAVGIVNVDEDPQRRAALDQAVEDIRRVPAIRDAAIVRLD